MHPAGLVPLPYPLRPTPKLNIMFLKNIMFLENIFLYYIIYMYKIYYTWIWLKCKKLYTCVCAFVNDFTQHPCDK